MQPVESKKERFKRLAEARTEKILDMIELLGNLSNGSFYEYTNEQVEKIFNAIELKTAESKAKFKKKNSDDKGRFRL